MPLQTFLRICKREPRRRSEASAAILALAAAADKINPTGHVKKPKGG